MAHQREQILIVDDDPGLRDLLTRYLREQGFAANAVADAAEMDTYLGTHPVDLIVLDLMLPGEDGLSVARRMRGRTPIVMLSARGEDVDRIVGLEVGADDYLAKPFNPRELLARIRAVLRRGTNANSIVGRPVRQVSEFGPYQLDPAAHRLTRDGEEISLTSGEFALLQVFAEHPNQVLSRDRLLDLIKGYERMPYDRSIDIRVTRLRRKVEPDPQKPRYIRTVWGEGYLFSPLGETE